MIFFLLCVIPAAAGHIEDRGMNHRYNNKQRKEHFQKKRKLFTHF